MRTLEITTKIGCPASCTVCPQDKLLAAYDGPEMMTPEMFTDIMEGTPVDVRVDFSGFCEPFANPNAVDFMIEAHVLGHSVAVFTTGLGLTFDGVQRLAQVPFDTFEVHLQDKHGISAIPQPGNLSDVLCAIKVRLTGVVCNDLAGIKVNARAGNVRGISVPKNTGALFCRGGLPERFVALPDGRVALCCMDYGLRHICGDITEVGYDGLSLTRGYSDVLAGMVEGDVLCRKCEWAVA